MSRVAGINAVLISVRGIVVLRAQGAVVVGWFRAPVVRKPRSAASDVSAHLSSDERTREYR
jgi:hypothetical protein